MKPKLKQPGNKRLKLKCELQLSTTAFKFNLRRQSQGTRCAQWSTLCTVAPQTSASQCTSPSACTGTQSAKISYIDVKDDHIDTVFSHIIRPFSISMSSRMTISIW